MNLLLSEEQDAIVDAIRGFLCEAAPVARLRPPAPQIGNADATLWPRLGEMGFLGLALPVDAGGSGLTVAEEALACREFGRYLLSPSVMGLMLGCGVVGDDDPILRERFARGEVRVALANPRGAARAVQAGLHQLCVRWLARLEPRPGNFTWALAATMAGLPAPAAPPL